MRCERARKWISDDLDGRLAGRRAEALARHLRSCAACRAYRGDLALIQVRSQAQPAPSLTPGEWTRFERSLERELGYAPSPGRRPALVPAVRTRLALVGAGIILVGATVFFLVKGGPPELDPAFLSYEGSLGQIDREIRDNPDLADSFNRLVMASIGDTIRAGQSDLPIDLLANPDFLEGWAGETWEDIHNSSGPNAP